MEPFVRTMRYIVDGVSEALVPVLREAVPSADITRISFFCGPTSEIIQKLNENAQDVFTAMARFPCVILFEDISNGRSGEYDTVRANMAIATYSEKDYSSEQRQEKSFDPILYPIRDALLQAIYKSRSFVIYDPRELPKGDDRKVWGSNGVTDGQGNKLTDHIDAIELNNFEIKLKPF